MFYGTTRGRIATVLMALILFSCVTMEAKQKLEAEAKRYMRSGNMYMGTSDYDTAAENYLKVLEIQPDYIEALKMMGDLDFYWGENKGEYGTNEAGESIHNKPDVAFDYYVKAYDYLSRALVGLNNPENEEKPGKARDEQLEMQKDVENKMKSSLIRLYNIGLRQSEAGNTDFAVTVLSKIIELDPTFTNAYILMSNIYTEKNNPEETLKYMMLAAEKSAPNADLYQNVAITYFNQKQYEQAIEWFRKASQIDPANIDFYDNIAVCYNILKDMPNALKALQQILAIQPENVDAMIRAGNIAYQLGEKDTAAQYLASFKGIADSGDLSADVYVLASILASQLDDNASSAQYLIGAINKNPQSPNMTEWLSALCTKLYNLKRWNDLLTYAEQWHQLAPEDVSAVTFCYHAAMNLKDKAKEEQYKKLLETMSKH